MFDPYAMRNAVMVESFELPLALNKIFPVVAEASLQLILRFPAGEVMKPDSETVT
jgi:hypothetical protein